MITTQAQNETNADYHADMSAVGHSMGSVYRQSPRLYHRWYVEGQRPDTTTESTATGSMVHTLVLEPEQFAATYDVVGGLATRRSKAWTDAKEDAKRSGLVPVLEHEVASARDMADAVLAHPIARKFIEAEGPVEHSIRWQHASGLTLKCRTDKLVTANKLDWRLVVDLKSSRTPGPGSRFLGAARAYDYFGQAAWYLDGCRSLAAVPHRFIWIVVGTEEPHDVFCYEAPAAKLAEAATENEELWARMSISYETNVWQHPGQNTITLLQEN